MATKRILLVEGNDDEHVFKAIFGQNNFAHLDEIKEHGGYPRWRPHDKPRPFQDGLASPQCAEVNRPAPEKMMFFHQPVQSRLSRGWRILQITQSVAFIYARPLGSSG